MPNLAEPQVKNTQQQFTAILRQVQLDYTSITFTEGSRFTWDALHQQVIYQRSKQNSTHAIFSLLHELGHAVLQHKDYTSDIGLLQLEVAAWAEARLLAKRYSVELDEDYIEDCLDSYRDWLHLRATCPSCYSRTLQASRSRYTCFNCQTEWQVSRSRLCRSYRLKTS